MFNSGKYFFSLFEVTEIFFGRTQSAEYFF